MQPRVAMMVILCLLASAAAVHAGDYTAVEIGDTGLTLKNSAYPQDKYYLKDDTALNGRVAALIADVDCLLAKLHALPPELATSPVATAPASAELKGLVELALAGNPDLQPFRSQLAVLAARTRQAGARQDPMVSLMLMDTQFPMIPPDNRVMTSAELEVSQMFDSYGKRKLKRNIARLDESIVQLELAAREQQVVREVTALYFEMAAVQAELKVLDDNIRLLDLLLELAESRYAVNDEMTPQAMVFDAQVMRTMLEERRIELANRLSRQGVQLSGLLGWPADFDPAQLNLVLDYPVPALPDWDEELLLTATLDLDPQYQRMRTMQQQEQLMLVMAQREYRPDYTLSARYNLEPGMRGMIGAGVMVPLFTNKEDRQDAQVQEAYSMVANTEDQLAAMENMLATMLGGMKVDQTQMTQMINLYRNALVPQARLALDSSIATYSANMLDLAELLRTQQRLLDLETELEQNYIKYLAMLADLQIATTGAFDPAPYLAPSLDTLGGTARQGLDSLPLVPRTEPALTPQAVEPGEFVEQLGLPQPDDNADGFSSGNVTTPQAAATAISRQVAASARRQVLPVAPEDDSVADDSAAPRAPESEAPPATADSPPDFYQPFNKNEDPRQ